MTNEAAMVRDRLDAAERRLQVYRVLARVLLRRAGGSLRIDGRELCGDLAAAGQIHVSTNRGVYESSIDYSIVSDGEFDNDPAFVELRDAVDTLIENDTHRQREYEDFWTFLQAAALQSAHELRLRAAVVERVRRAPNSLALHVRTDDATGDVLIELFEDAPAAPPVSAVLKP